MELRKINILTIVIITLVVYSAVATIINLITQNDDVLLYFGAGIVGLIVMAIIKIAGKIYNQFKYHIGKRSIFEEKGTGKQFRCDVKYAATMQFNSYKYILIKRCAKKEEWKGLPDIPSQVIDEAKEHEKNDD